MATTAVASSASAAIIRPPERVRELPRLAISRPSSAPDYRRLALAHDREINDITQLADRYGRTAQDDEWIKVCALGALSKFGNQVWAWFHSRAAFPSFGWEVFNLTAGCLQRIFRYTPLATIIGMSANPTVHSFAHAQDAAYARRPIDQFVGWLGDLRYG